jgi:hypothetical protein
MRHHSKHSAKVTPHFTHKLDVIYEGQHHAVTSFEDAWVLANQHVPASAIDLQCPRHFIDKLVEMQR